MSDGIVKIEKQDSSDVNVQYHGEITAVSNQNHSIQLDHAANSKKSP